ncbi:DUF6221 family protein [Streptomyces erythrochromogenes]|uniref:DUF6221 family protein n=1 Tax=Streptomyces erythrochromogenes TaxID=285574 RepID=UPI0036B4AFC3
MDLVQFIRDRLNNDEQVARAAMWDEQSDTWTARPPQARYEQYIVADYCDDGVVVVTPENADADGVGQHIARHDPARVLAEVDAKRRTLDLHGIVHRNIGWRDADGEAEYAELPVCGHCVPKHTHYLTREGVAEGPCTTVRLLGLPHADHLDYRDDWRP